MVVLDNISQAAVNKMKQIPAAVQTDYDMLFNQHNSQIQKFIVWLFCVVGAITIGLVGGTLLYFLLISIV